jgi:valyl-tRNA synthetase
LYGEDDIKREDTVSVLVYVLKEILKLLHPFVPFITEKIYKSIPGAEGALMLAEFPRYNGKRTFSSSVKDIEPVKEIIKNIRNIKVKMGAAPSKKVSLFVKAENKKPVKNGAIYIQKLSGVSDIQFIEDKSLLTEKVVSQVIEGIEFFIPLGELVDLNKEIERLEKELGSVSAEIARASGKLSNNGFLEKAPKSLVDSERAKLNKFLDIRDKIMSQIKDLKG